MKDYQKFLEEKLKVQATKTDVSFSTVDINTPFVKDAISLIATQTGDSIKEVHKNISDKLDASIEKLDGPDRLYKVQKQNMVESIIFDEVNKLEIPEAAFNQEDFRKLFDYVLVRNKSFLKIKDPITGKKLKLNIIYTPQPSFIKQPQWVTSVSTAAASPEGDLIFNTKFVEQLSKYALIKQIKPKGKIYVSNGGSIPDKYAYLEFLIMHEIYHIVHGDHFYQSKKEGMSPLAQNYLGDFITNYNLVKAGYEQLPTGLFSNDYNYDHFNTMNDMQDAIIEDMKELNKDQKDQMTQQMDDHLDQDHNNSKDQQPSDDSQDSGSQDSQDSQDTQGDSGDSQDSQDSGSQDSQDSKDSKGDSGSQDSGSQDSQDSGGTKDKDTEQSFKDSDKQMANAEDAVENIDEEVKKMKQEQQQQSAEHRDQIKKDLEKRRAEQQKSIQELSDKVKTPINWKKLIKKMFPAPKVSEEESLTKMHRRTRAQLAISKKGSPISVKAGTVKKEEESQSLMFILDKSGSMGSVVDAISNELLMLINKNMSLGVDNMFICMFDSNYDVYKINIDKKGKKHTYQPLQNPLDIIKEDPDKLKLQGSPKPIKSLFQISWGLGTEYPKELNLIINKLIKENYNQVLFTDTDILSGDNMRNLKKSVLLGNKKPYSFNIILDDKASYSQVKKALGGTYKYMSYLNSENQ